MDSEILVDRIRLRQYAIYHVVALVQTGSFLQHILRFGFGWVGCSKGVDVGSNVCEEVLPVASLGDGGLQTPEFLTMLTQDFTMAG